MLNNHRRTNELLGYPPDARLLILNTDDYGMCHSINQAIIHSIKSGVASSCTLMAPCPWALHAMHLLKENPEISFGVHLTAVSEAEHYRWGPIVPTEQVPSLLDEAGYFYSEERIPEFLKGVNLAELELEFRAQIEAVLKAGLNPTHVDGHCLVTTRREDIFDMTVSLAREYGLAVRVTTPEFIDKLQKQGYPTNDYDVLDSYRLETPGKLNRYLELLRNLPEGLSEWAIHPSTPTAELQAIFSEWEVRQADYEFLISPDTRETIEKEGIIVLDYRRLQELWQK